MLASCNVFEIGAALIPWALKAQAPPLLVRRAGVASRAVLAFCEG